MSNVNLKDLINEWTGAIWRVAGDIDPDSQMDWRDMAYGYARGKGCDDAEAHDFVVELDHRRLL